MKSLLAAIFCLFSFTQIHGAILSSFESELSSITDPVVGQISTLWREYVVGLASELNVAENLLYAILNGTNGVSGWVKLTTPLSALSVTRFIWNTTNIGDLTGLTLVNSLNNLLSLQYIELDTRGSLLFLNGLALNYNGTSGQGYGYANFDVPVGSTTASVLNGLSSTTGLLTSLLSGTQLSTVTNTVTELLSLLNLSPILGLLGGL